MISALRTYYIIKQLLTVFKRNIQEFDFLLNMSSNCKVFLEKLFDNMYVHTSQVVKNFTTHH